MFLFIEVYNLLESITHPFYYIKSLIFFDIWQICAKLTHVINIVLLQYFVKKYILLLCKLSQYFFLLIMSFREYLSFMKTNKKILLGIICTYFSFCPTYSQIENMDSLVSLTIEMPDRETIEHLRTKCVGKQVSWEQMIDIFGITNSEGRSAKTLCNNAHYLINDKLEAMGFPRFMGTRNAGTKLEPKPISVIKRV